MRPMRALRHLGLDHNPLRRTSDRIEAWVTLGLLATVLLGGPVAAWAAGAAAYRAVLQTASTRQQNLFPVHAILEEDRLLHPATGSEVNLQPPPARARWTGPDGSAHSGEIDPDKWGRAGTAVQVWTDGTGNLASPPPRRQDAVGRGLTVALLTLAGLTVLTGGARLALRRGLDRRRLASWQLEWMLIEPRWSGRRRR